MTPIQLTLCKEYLANAQHRGNCPLCWKNDATDATCTCGLSDLTLLISSMERGTKLALSVNVPGLETRNCDVPGCGLSDVPHKHVRTEL